MLLVTNQQLYLAIGIPMLFNASLIGLVMAFVNAKFSSVNSRFSSIDSRFSSIDSRFSSIEARFASLESSIDARFNAIDKRFDDMRDLWRAELRRVEEVLDARLKHLEERG